MKLTISAVLYNVPARHVPTRPAHVYPKTAAKSIYAFRQEQLVSCNISYFTIKRSALMKLQIWT